MKTLNDTWYIKKEPIVFSCCQLESVFISHDENQNMLTLKYSSPASRTCFACTLRDCDTEYIRTVLLTWRIYQLSFHHNVWTLYLPQQYLGSVSLVNTNDAGKLGSRFFEIIKRPSSLCASPRWPSTSAEICFSLFWS